CGRRDRMEGEVHEVLEHSTKTIVGRFTIEDGVAFVLPNHTRITHDIIIPAGEEAAAKPGSIVIAEISRQPTSSAPPLGKIIKVMGEYLAPGLEIDIAIESH